MDLIRLFTRYLIIIHAHMEENQRIVILQIITKTTLFLTQHPLIRSFLYNLFLIPVLVRIISW